MKSIVKVNIRKRHPNLYYLICVRSLLYIALGFNFFFYTPTFNPLHISKDVIGAIFMLLGVVQLVFLNVSRDLRVVRLIMAASLSFVLFWGLANTQQVFAGKASFQLPLLYVGLALMQFPTLVEPAVNPVTEKIRHDD